MWWQIIFTTRTSGPVFFRYYFSSDPNFLACTVCDVISLKLMVKDNFSKCKSTAISLLNPKMADRLIIVCKCTLVSNILIGTFCRVSLVAF